MKLLKREEIDDKYKWNLKLVYETLEDWENSYNEVGSFMLEFEKYKGNISLEEYLQMTPTFLDELDREFIPDIDTSEAFREFLSASKRYNSGMKLQRVPREE